MNNIENPASSDSFGHLEHRCLDVLEVFLHLHFLYTININFFYISLLAHLLPIVRETLESGLRHIRRYLDQSAFAMVDLGQIFAGLRALPSENSQEIGSAATVNTSMMTAAMAN